MKRTVVAASLLVLAVTGCSSQSGDSNTDSQVKQPPAPDSTTQQTQGPNASIGPVPTSTDPADQTGGNGTTG